MRHPLTFMTELHILYLIVKWAQRLTVEAVRRERRVAKLAVNTAQQKN